MFLVSCVKGLKVDIGASDPAEGSWVTPEKVFTKDYNLNIKRYQCYQ